MIKGHLLILGGVLALSLLRIALAKPLRRTRWFKTSSLTLAVWAAGWALAVIGLSKAFALTHPALELIALAPILSILISMFFLVIIEMPVFWYASFLKFLAFSRSGR